MCSLQIGDALWRYLGPLEEKTRLLIEERMRKSYAVIKRPAAIEPRLVYVKFWFGCSKIMYMVYLILTRFSDRLPYPL